MQRRSRRARLVMLTAVGALLLAAVPGLAEPGAEDPTAEDTVTINVEAAARTIALNVEEEEPATFDITAGEEFGEEDLPTVDDRSLDYASGEDSTAKITVASNIVAETPGEDEVDLADLTLAVQAAGPETESDGIAEDDGDDVGVSLNAAGDSDSDLITSIEPGANVANLGLTYTLTGDAPDCVTGGDNKADVTVTYTLTDAGEEP